MAVTMNIHNVRTFKVEQIVSVAGGTMWTTVFFYGPQGQDIGHVTMFSDDTGSNFPSDCSELSDLDMRKMGFFDKRPGE